MAIARVLESPTFLPFAEAQPLRVGVLLDSLLIPHWVLRILEEIQQLNDVKLVTVAILGNGKSSNVQSEDGHAPKVLRVWRDMETRFFCRRSPHHDALTPKQFSPTNGAVILSQASQSDAECTAQTLAELISMQLDVLLNLSSAAPTRELQAIAKHGMLWFGDEESLLADLLWLLYEKGSVLRNTLNISSSDTGTATLDVCYCAADKYSLFRNVTENCWRRWEPVHRWLNEVKSNDGHRHCEGMITLPGSSHSIPGNLECASLLLRILARLVHDKCIALLDREEWFIAFRKSDVTGSSMLHDSDFTLLRAPSNHFYADPFVIDQAGKTFIFFEDYSYASRKAVISFITIDTDGKCSSPDVALEENYHLAYPCLFTTNGQIYLLPETKNNKTIQLYRAVQFPNKWRLENVLQQNVSAVDSTLLHHRGKFWLFTSGLNSQDPWFSGDSELFLFFADSLQGPWRSHPKNPIVTDVRKCRGAGQIQNWNGRLIRPAQDCSFHYGYAVVLNRVDVLSESDYHETPIATISPDWLPANRGTHTFNRSQTHDVLDGRILVNRFTNGHATHRFETATPLRPIFKQV
jgi:hypothetical protein